MRIAFASLASLAILMCAAHVEGDDAGTTVKVQVPQRVAELAAARAAGDATAPPPILVLEGVELEAGERLTIEVHGPGEPGSRKPGPLLGTAAMVGSHDRDRSAPPEPYTLLVPLVDEASGLLAGQREVTLTLTVRNAPERRLTLHRAYFDEGEPE